MHCAFGNAQLCALQVGTASCFKRVGKPQVCPEQQSCKEQLGCTCDDDIACVGPGGHCNEAGEEYTCAPTAKGCLYVASPPADCQSGEVCEGTQGVDAGCQAVEGDIVGSVVINGGDATTPSDLVTLAFSATGPSAIVSVSYGTNAELTDGTWTAFVPSATFRFNAYASAENGTMTVFARFKDAAGRVSPVVSDDIQLARVLSRAPSPARRSGPTTCRSSSRAPSSSLPGSL